MSDGKSWGRNAVSSASIGAAIGLAWATSLRAWMTHLTIEFGSWPQFTLFMFCGLVSIAL